MTLAEEFSIKDWNYTLKKTAEREKNIGIGQGIKQGIEQINDIYSWLYENGRDEDVKKGIKDPEYRKQLFDEYSGIMNGVLKK